MNILFFLFTIIYSVNATLSLDDIRNARNTVKNMFYHAYDGYIKYAMPYDELRPLTCDGHDTWGSYSLTLIDALDTLAVINNRTEFQRVYSLVAERSSFEADINVSVFETNIRIVGGLLTGHLFARRMGVAVDSKWPCEGPLLRLAKDAATRLLPAFDTPTGMPYGTVNLKKGVPDGETPITCVAGVGTFIVEFGTISRLTGEDIFEKVALRAIHSMWQRKSHIGLIGNHIDVITGKWTSVDAGIGAGVDSFFEYLVKGSFMFQRPELMSIFNEAKAAINHHLKFDDWYLWKSIYKPGRVSMIVFQSLEAFWPGVLTLVGDLEQAQKTMFNYHQILKQYGFHPEFYSINEQAVYPKRTSYPLRPEFAESLVYLYQATRDHTYLKMGLDLIETIEHSAKTPCGYATIRDVSDHTLENRMESFFLAETTKYLYLLFHEDHWLHANGGSGRLHKVGNRDCVIESGTYFFNTEAHPIDTGALACCHGPEGPDQYMSVDDILTVLQNPDNLEFLSKNEKPAVKRKRRKNKSELSEFKKVLKARKVEKVEKDEKADGVKKEVVNENEINELNVESEIESKMEGYGSYSIELENSESLKDETDFKNLIFKNFGDETETSIETKSADSEIETTSGSKSTIETVEIESGDETKTGEDNPSYSADKALFWDFFDTEVGVANYISKVLLGKETKNSIVHDMNVLYNKVFTASEGEISAQPVNYNFNFYNYIQLYYDEQKLVCDKEFYDTYFTKKLVQLRRFSTSTAASKLSIGTVGKIVNRIIEKSNYSLPSLTLKVNTFLNDLDTSHVNASLSLLSCPKSFLQFFSFKGQLMDTTGSLDS